MMNSNLKWTHTYGKLHKCFMKVFKFDFNHAANLSSQVLQKTRTAHTSNPFWNQKFEFDEIVDDGCLKIKCYSEEMFGDENIGSARVNLEGLLEGSIRDIWVPLEKVNSGELRLQIDAVRVNDAEGSRVLLYHI